MNGVAVPETMTSNSAGSRQARFERLVVEESPRLLRMARRLLGDDEAAREVVQEGLLRAQRSLAGFRDEGPLAAWMQRIVVNQALRRLRRRRLRRRLETWLGKRREQQPDPLGWLQPASQPHHELERLEQLKHLHRALEQLSPRQHQVVALRYLEQQSLDEIAGVTGLGRGTVKTHLVRGLRTLRRLLQQDAGGSHEAGKV